MTKTFGPYFVGNEGTHHARWRITAADRLQLHPSHTGSSELAGAQLSGAGWRSP